MDWLLIKNWFKNGIERLKWFVALISERLHIELAVIKLLNSIEELKKKRTNLMIKIGERVIQLKEIPSHDVFTDQEIKSILKEVEDIEREIRILQEKAHELSKLEG